MGTWDFVADDGPTGSLSFDAYGNWVGGAAGANLCAGTTMNGTYTFEDGTLEFVTIHDSSICHSDWILTYTVAFDANCATAQLDDHIDNCTGGHQELGPEMALTRR